MAANPLIVLVIAASIVSALNPSTIGVLIMLCSVVLGKGHRLSRVFWIGLSFIVCLLTTSLLLGVVTLYLFNLLPLSIAEYLAICIGILIVYAGVIEVKNYFWYGRGLGLRLGEKATAHITSLTKGHITFRRAAWLGIFTGLVSLSCTGAAYLSVITILRDNFDLSSLELVGVYNLIFVLPLALLVSLIATGVKVSSVQRWKEESKGKMRLGVGLLLIGLGWIVILIANGVLNFE